MLEEEYEECEDGEDEDGQRAAPLNHTEAAYSRGVAHGIAAALKVISGPGKTRDEAFDELETFAQVVCDWRNGRASINGWSGEPWHWSKESYQEYLDKFRDTW